MRVYLIAGEPSGDVIGANLIESLKKQTNNNSIEFSGVGGERMIQAGLSKSISPSSTHFSAAKVTIGFVIEAIL